jgi:hypothetical protein
LSGKGNEWAGFGDSKMIGEEKAEYEKTMIKLLQLLF